MLLGALLDAGVKVDELQNELSKLGLDSEYSLQVSKVVKKGIAATDVQVDLISHVHHHHDHAEPHAHTHNRNLADIAHIIDNSSLDTDIKLRAKYVFQRLAAAEAKVHGTTIDKIHFHEVGAVDAIIDICGTVIALTLLGIEKIFSSPLPTGSGFIECAHGIIPIPAPATAELIKNVPVYNPAVKGELITPTGAALITTLADSFGPMPAMTVTEIGYGAGNKDFGLPNVLRVFVGTTSDDKEPSIKGDKVHILETTLDDCSPELLGYLWDQIFAAGALDMYYTPVYMKKGRPATHITILTSENNLPSVSKILFNETSTIGVRISVTSRFCLERETKLVETTLGPVHFKISGNTIKPEFEDLRSIATANSLPLKEVYQKAMAEFHNI